MVDPSLSQLGVSATGVNTDQIISQMRYLEERPIRNMEDEISQIERKKDAWRDVNSRISKLDNLLDKLKEQDTYNSMTTSSSDKELMTASADPEASTGSYDITINQKAQAQRVVGSTKVAEATSSGTENITDIAMEDGKTYEAFNIDNIEVDETTYQYGLVDGSNNIVAVSENGESYTALESSTTNDGNLDSSKITGEDYNFGYELNFGNSSGDTGTILKMHGTDGDQQNTLTQNSLYDTVGSDPTINGTTIDMTANDTLSDMVTKINESDSGVNASVVDNRVVLESNQTGADNSINLVENGGNLLTDLGVYDSTNSDNGYVNEGGTDGIEDTTADDAEDGYQPAQDAEITVNGISGITSSNNTFDSTVNGVSFNIQSSANAGDSTTIDVNADTGKAKKAVQKVVDQYNSVVDFISNKTSVTGSGEDAEGKILQGDGTANRIINRMKSTILESIPTGNEIDYMSELGLEFDSANYDKLTLDSGKLSDAIKNDPGQVHEFFAPDASEDDDYDYDGLATRLKDYTNSLIETEGIIPNRTDRLGDQVKQINEDIDDYQENVDMQMERMKEQFTQMETIVSNYNNQSSWLSSQISSLGLE